MHAVRRSSQPLPFPEVVTRHQQAVYRYLYRCTRNPQDTQDLFQETFLRAYRAYAALPADADHRAWLMRIAINLSKNYVRDRRRRMLVEENRESEEKGELLLKTGMDTEETMIARETAQRLLAAIDALPFRQRTALIQRQFEGLEYHVIANNLACSPEAARAHVYQALRKLRLCLPASVAQLQKE
ncbi:MAG: sigma-70 family RNA polymerase sigma factor [Candidatus Binatia bacterium]|nr:sigma-70 family RNA polymerase sigma factor [Candidatus Binatia bacterium]